MTMATVDVTTIEPLTHPEAMRRQALELERTLTLLRSLDDASWTAATDCPAWDVRAMYQHVLGACEAGASVRENIHQLRAARAYRKRHGVPARSSPVRGTGTRARQPDSSADHRAARGCGTPHRARPHTHTCARA